LTLRALGLKGKSVALPNSVCPNVPMAVLYSGNTPLFLDVDRRDWGLSRRALERCGRRVDAVLAVHAYGAVCRIEEIAAYCRARGVPLIEDLAVAQGATIGLRPAGSFGDASVVSFGAGKIVSYGFGGAVLADDPRLLAEIQRLQARLPSFTRARRLAARRVMLGLRDGYNRWLGRDLNGFWRSFRRSALASRDAFLHGFSPAWEDGIFRALGGLQKNVAARRRRAALLARALEDADPRKLSIFSPPEGSVPWRFNVLVRDRRDDLLRRLLAKGVPVSSWQMPADLLFGPRSARRAPMTVSDEIGDRILNLWVNDEIEGAYLKDTAAEIVSHTRREK
jgi:dTDP-4-amino-4,6-dideoxygalactose transaminase